MYHAPVPASGKLVQQSIVPSIMKKLGFTALAILGLFVNLQAQEIDDVNGKTYYYYDSLSRKKVKEIFHHIQEFHTRYDKHGNTHDTILYIKNGPYTRYYENGKLNCSGYYKREEKTGTWKFYNEAGKLIRTEEWASGKLVRTSSH